MRRLLNDGWEFAKLPPGSALKDALALPDSAWAAVDVPHDWLIGQEGALYEDGDGWYRRALEVSGDRLGDTWQVCFDGVYMDCDVLLNGVCLATHRYGYTAFRVTLDPALRAGCNLLMVCARHRAPSSRWYTGAGIYRDVTLDVLPPVHLLEDTLYVHSAPDGTGWRVDVRCALSGEGTATALLRDGDGRLVDEAQMVPGEDGRLAAALCVPKPRLWSPEEPKLYALTLACGAHAVERRIGLRTIAFDPARGLALNGAPFKLHGVCLHHDLGALGAAFRPEAFRRQLRLMKDMGANALRTAHNPPASAALSICDEEGMLVMDEAFDVWTLPKTAMDYARFFPDCWRQDVESWVCRDRNHPCVVLWSIGNEIQDTHLLAEGPAITAALRDEVRRHDPDGNAFVTFGSNYLPWENTRRCADLLKIVGYNYGEKYYAAHRAAHPDWVVYGSETGSILSSRGVYHFPAGANILSDEDLQCSSLGNSATSWGTRDMRACLVDDLNDPASPGQFLWSGVDYIGEPTPYHTRSCHFGMADTALFPKDFFHQVRSLWNPEPMAHIGVRWDWNAGQGIDVPVYANGASCELFLNGRSLGRKALDPRAPERSMAWWRVPYEHGTLLVRSYDAQGREIARDERRSFGDSAALRIEADRPALRADGEDIVYVTVTAADARGNPVENACDRVFAELDGPALLLGMDNGDSTDPDGYAVSDRRLFSGKLRILLGAMDRAGEATLRVRAKGLAGAALTLPILPAPIRPGVSRAFVPRTHPTGASGEPEVRRIDLAPEGDVSEGGILLTPERPELRVAAKLLPAYAAPQPIAWRLANAAGIDVPFARLIPEGDGVRIVGLSDGEAFLRASCTNGAAHPRVISQLEVALSGFGTAHLDPYGFVAGGLCDLTDGEITPGNDRGVAFARDGISMAGFTGVDFGPGGSDEITLPIFALDGEPCHIELWLGDPRQDGRLLATLRYQKPSVWNTYQPETWTLPERITGVQTLCFRLNRKLHLKGFSFARMNRAWRVRNAGDADELYGDQFRRDGTAVRDIGNNVTLLFRDLDFQDARRAALCLTGSTELPVNPIQVRIADAAGGGTVQECAFPRGARTCRFEVDVPGGRCDVAFVFLPGCRFDFERFAFERI